VILLGLKNWCWNFWFYLQRDETGFKVSNGIWKLQLCARGCECLFKYKIFWKTFLFKKWE